MRILLASSSSGSRGGGEIFLLYLAEALKTAGHHPILWCASHPRMDELANSFSQFGNVYRDPYPNSYLDRPTRVLGSMIDRKTRVRISKRWTEIAPDVIHVNKQTLEDGLDLLAAAKNSGLPYITTIHITQSNRSLGAKGARLRDGLASRELKKHTNAPITAVSDLRTDELQSFLSREVDTIYNAVPDLTPTDRSRTRKKIFADYGWPEETVLVVCLARLVPQKDPPRFLRLASKWHRRDSKTRFLWIGDGDLKREFSHQAEKIGLADIVATTGWIAKPHELLESADIYLHPAAYEGLPLSILEAMSASLPCILSPEIIAEARVFSNSSVIPCPESDDSWLVPACSASEREIRGKASRTLYEKHFRPQSMAQKFLQIYHRTSPPMK